MTPKITIHIWYELGCDLLDGEYATEITAGKPISLGLIDLVPDAAREWVVSNSRQMEPEVTYSLRCELRSIPDGCPHVSHWWEPVEVISTPWDETGEEIIFSDILA